MTRKPQTAWLSVGTALVLACSSAAVRADSRVAQAARSADVAAVRSLIKQRADVNGQEADGSTALLWATYRLDVDMVRALLELAMSRSAMA